MNALLKKIFTVGVVTTTIFWSLGVASLVQVEVANAETFPTLVAGQMIKVIGKAPIYVINGKGEALYFPTGDEFKSHFMDLVYKGKYTSITMAHFDTIKVPAVQPISAGFLQGSTLVKRESSDTLYVVQPGNTLAEIDATTATALGYSVSKAFEVKLNAWGAYTGRANKITSAVAHPGMFVKVNNVTYYVDATDKLREISAAGLSANRVKLAFVRSLGASSIAGKATGEKIDGVLPEISDPTQSGIVASTPVSGGSLSVALASDTPAAGYAFASASRVPFTKVVFTAGSNAVKIDSFKVKRAGDAAVDADFSTINVVTPEGTLLNDSGKTPNSDHEVTFTEDILVPANSSKTYTLVGMMAAAATMVAGNVPKLSLISVVSDASSVSGLPVTGNAMSTNESKTLGAVSVAEGSSVGSPTKQVGAVNVLLASFKVTNTGSADTKQVKVEKLQLYNSGTVADADLSNFKLKYNSNVVATGMMVNKYLSFDLSSCTADCTLEKGYDRTYEVYGDLTAGSGRTLNLDFQYGNHVAIKDLDNNVYLAPATPSAFTNTITISQGKLNVSKLNDIPAGNIPKNAKNVELASWNFNVVGEPIDIRTLVFEITTTGTAKPEMLDTLTLYNAAGTAVIGGIDGVGATVASVGYATSTDTFTLPAGDNKLVLKGTVDNTSTLVAGDTFSLAIDMHNTSNFIARGQNSNLDITLGTYALPQGDVDANLRTINTSALAITTLTTPAARTVAAGSNEVEFARVMFDAGNSSEDMKVSQVIITDTPTLAAAANEIQNLKIYVDKDGDSYNGSGTVVALTEAVSGTEATDATAEDFTFNLSGNDQFIVKAGKKLVVTFKGNITGGAGIGAHVFSVNTANDVAATGVTTSSAVSETIDTAAAGQAMTVGTAGGQVAAGLASDNPSAALMAAGTDVTLASFNFLATTTEDVELDYLYLTQVVTATASSSYKDYDEIWFVNEAGAEISGTRMSPTSTNPKVDFADGTAGAFVIPVSDSDGVNIYLKAKLAMIGTGYNGVSDHAVGYKINAAADVIAKGKQSGSGALEFLGATVPTGLTHYTAKGYPKLEKLAVPTNKLSNGTLDLFKFKVTAVNNDIALYKFTFDFASTVAIVTNLYVYDVTDTSSEKELNATAGTAPYNVWESSAWDGTGATASQVTVSKTQPRTFVVRGNVASAGTGASISVRIAGDASHTVTGVNDRIATEVDSDPNDEFIWSDKSASGHTITTDDWTNGYLVSGLSSISSSAETLSY